MVTEEEFKKILSNKGCAWSNFADAVIRNMGNSNSSRDPLLHMVYFVRDLPYRRPINGTSADAVLTDMCGTCSGKHFLLHDALHSFGIHTSVMMGAYQVDKKSTGIPDLVQRAMSEDPFWDVHNYLFLASKENIFKSDVLDVTWPVRLVRAGMGNKHFSFSRSYAQICTPALVHVKEIPAGDSGLKLKKELLAELNSASQLDARENFILALSNWAKILSTSVNKNVEYYGVRFYY